MVTIGKIPRKLQGFFKPLRNHFTRRAREHSWALVLAVTINHGCTVERLARLLRASANRTNHGEFCGEASGTNRRLCRISPRICCVAYSPTKTAIFFISSTTHRPSSEPKRWPLWANCSTTSPENTETAIRFLRSVCIIVGRPSCYAAGSLVRLWSGRPLAA